MLACLKKNRILYVIATILLGLLINTTSSARYLYNDRTDLINEQLNYSQNDLEEDAKSNNEKALYLLSLRMIAGDSQQKNYAVRTFNELANKGISDAKYSLYETQEYTGITESQAIQYLTEAANEGNPLAQEEVAIIYSEGKFWEKDLNVAHQWMEKSAQSGNPDAMKNMAIEYFNGLGVVQNNETGFYWLEKYFKAAGRKFNDWSFLGKAYETGRGTPINLVKAYMCYDLEGTAGIRKKSSIASKMTADQRAEGLQLSADWQRMNHVYTMQSLGLTRQQDGSYR